MNVSVDVAAALLAAGHDAIHVVEAGLRGHPDKDIMNFSRMENRVLLTADTDFGELLSRSGKRFPSVILFRRTARRPQHQAALVIVNLADIEDELVAGSLIVLTESSIRIRRLPI